MTKDVYYDLTNPQRNIWLTEQFYSNTAVNNICGTLLIKEKVDFNILRKAINIFVKENCSFRFKFIIQDSHPKQYLDDFSEIHMNITNLKDLDDLSNFEKELAVIPIFSVDQLLFKFNIFRLDNGFGGFVILLHHLIGDAWTMGLVANKIVEIYTSLKENSGYINSVPTSYTDYIVSENKYLNSESYKKDKMYWESLFNHVPDIASLPGSLPSQDSLNSSKALREKFLIDENISNKINKFCKEYKVSPFNFFMGIFAIYISRICNLEEFVLGTPILNRGSFKEKNTTGMFISTMPFKINISNSSFSDFISIIAKDSLSMLRHQRYPYKDILEFIRMDNPNMPNLYDILFSYQNMRSNTKNSITQYDMNWTFSGNVSGSLDIHLFDLNDAGSFSIAYDYNISKYSKDDILNMNLRIMNIIHEVLKNPLINLSDIEIIHSDEKREILYGFNNTQLKYNMPNSIIEWIEIIAKSNLDKIAIETDANHITYKELIDRVNMLANFLISSKKIKSRSNIGILTNRSIDTIVGILAILKINCTYVPIDPNYPLDRISYMIDKSCVSYVLTDDISLKSKIKTDNSLSYIDISYNEYINQSTEFKYILDYNKENNLYIIFTSGSTGNPKGVTISHKNMMNLIHFEVNKTDIFDTNNRILQFATMSFDVSYQEIFSSLMLGATLVLVEDSIRKDSIKLSNYILNKKINILFIPPAYLRLLCEDDDIVCKFHKCLHSVITAGEALVITKGIKDLVLNGVKLYNHYGPAETHVVTTYKVDKDNILADTPIGYPISNSKIYILDSTNNLSPINTVGQIAISGDCVGNGYFNDTELTNEKFIYDKFTGNTMYLTGDLGFFDDSGCIHFIGRSDFQIKLNGFRIELSEIDAIIMEFVNIVSSVSVIQESNGKKHIISYYTCDKDINQNDLLTYIKSKLPYYMIPSKLVKLDIMPINNNGKIDKKKLPKVNLIDIANSYKAPNTKTETKLQKIWNELFDTSKISTDIDFFNAGGDSLLAIKLSAKILSVFNVEISVAEIFDNSNIINLSKLIDKKSVCSVNKIKKAEKLEYYPASSAQKRIYYSSYMAGKDSTLYNMPGGIILDSIPDVNKLAMCINELIKRHEVLRTSFKVIDGNIAQYVHDNVNFNFIVEDGVYSNINNIFKDFVKPFDLSIAPLIRAKLVKFENNKALLLIDMHHIISDGVSLSIFVNDLCNLYNGLKLPNSEISYKDYSVWEQDCLESGVFDESKDYWVKQFSDDIPTLNFPTSYPRPINKSFEGAKVYFNTNKKMTSKIYEVCNKLNITPFMLLLSAYYILVSKYSSQSDIVIGTPIVGRNSDELNNVIGMFVNTLALRNTVDNSLKFKDFVGIIKKNSINAFKNQLYPFDELISNLDIKKDSSRNPLFDMMFVYQNNGNAKVNLDNISYNYYIPDNKVSKFDITLEIIPENDILNMSFEYCTELFSEDFIKNLSVHYINILNIILENTSIKITDIDMISKDELHQILYNFNNQKLKYPNSSNLIDIFNGITSKYSSNICVTHGDLNITYNELDKKSNFLSKKLYDCGVRKGDVVRSMFK